MLTKAKYLNACFIGSMSGDRRLWTEPAWLDGRGLAKAGTVNSVRHHISPARSQFFSCPNSTGRDAVPVCKLC